MKLEASLQARQLHFIRPAKTSRNVFRKRLIHLIELKDVESGRRGFGECAPLSLLSVDDKPEYAHKLKELVDSINRTSNLPDLNSLMDWPSMVFGLETAMKELTGPGSGVLWDNDFSRGEAYIPINGLVWMNEPEAMKAEALQKLAQGYECMKFKVGAFPLDVEWQLIAECREQYPDVIFRLDANGAYEEHEALSILDRWSDLNIHSIEQPLKAGNWEAMAHVCRHSTVPIALDEELIGLDMHAYARMMDIIQPAYVILKPSLIGGFEACEARITLAEEKGAGWWVTSALEGNIGLRAIAQWTASLDYHGHQGLGTGALYENNIDCGLSLLRDRLYHRF